MLKAWGNVSSLAKDADTAEALNVSECDMTNTDLYH